MAGGQGRRSSDGERVEVEVFEATVLFRDQERGGCVRIWRRGRSRGGD